MLASLSVAALVMVSPGLPQASGHGDHAPFAVCAGHAPTDPKIERLVALAWAEANDQPKSPFAHISDAAHRRALEEDYALGKRYAEMVEKELPLSQNQQMQERLDRVASEIIAVAQERQVEVSWGDRRLNWFPYQFRVLEGSEVNAFSLPGGFIYFYEGLMDFVETDHELAGVVAHEIAHASFRHIATLQREQSRIQNITLPLILISIFSGSQSGADIAGGAALFQQAMGSGWSVNAETAADWGAVQYMVGTQYSPVGVLTFMERLASRERLGPNFLLGIYRTHPPSRERAEALVRRLGQLNVPIRRSVTTTSFRAMIEPREAGTYAIVFNNATLVTLAGVDAADRAPEVQRALNEFFDRNPSLIDVRAQSDGTVLGFRRPLFRLTQRDAEYAETTIDVLAQRVVAQIERGLYALNFRRWSM